MNLHTMDCVVINKCIRKYPNLIADFIKDSLKMVESDDRRAYDGENTHAFLKIYENNSGCNSYGPGIYRKKYHTNLTEIAKKFEPENPEYQEFYSKIKKSYSYYDILGLYTNFTIKYDCILQDTIGTDFINALFRNGRFFMLPSKYFDGLLQYIDYIKENIADIDLIDEVLGRIVKLGINYFVLDPNCCLDGKKEVNFYYQRKPNSSAGNYTRLSISDGEIVEKNTTDLKNYNYSTTDSNYAMLLTIKPENSLDFDLENNRGYYTDNIKKNHGNNSENIKVNGLVLNKLAFDPATLPASLVLDETLYRIFPELKKRVECNLVVHNCAQINKELSAYIKKLENLNNFDKDGLVEQQRSGLKKQYLEMNDLLQAMADIVQVNMNAIDDNPKSLNEENPREIVLESDNK